MLFKLSILSFFVFSALYPLCIWLNGRDKLKSNFHHFHLGLPAVTGGILVGMLFFSNIPETIQYWIVGWELLLLCITAFYWKKESANPVVLTVVSILGILLFVCVQSFLINDSVYLIIASLIAGCILTTSMYAMNLGHYYLNVHGLNMKYIRNATAAFWAFVLLRFIWDIRMILTETIMYNGEDVPLTYFMIKTDGFILMLAIFFGTLFPLIANYFVMETIKLKNTQSATGILYVILSAILIGDLSYKYYFLKYGIYL